MNCPICSANAVYASHRRGFLERGPFTWIGVLPFRCGQCQARFYRIARTDPRRRSRRRDSGLPVDQVHAPRWDVRMRATVSVTLPGQPGVVLEGASENASLEGACLRLPAALPQGSQVSVSLEGGPGTIGTVRWIRQEADKGFLHGIDYRVPLHQHAMHAQPSRRLRLRRALRRALIALIGLAGIALAAYTVASLLESLRFYDPWKKFYEPKDTERERYELLRRAEEMKRQGRP
jgi:PilZ domain-containing protein